jgi:membrane fusion protein (multidrug efflux system)
MSHVRFVPRITAAAIPVLLISMLSACGEKPANAQAPGGAMPPPEVSVVTVAPTRIVVTTELPGRLDASRVAQVRARAAGIVLKREYREGTDVKAGQVLFRIDPAPFQATYNSTQAALSRAEANLAAASLKVKRYRPLVDTNAISKQEFDDAITAEKQAAADVASAKAARENARLSLGYATVTAPISGRIGRAQVTEGALVGQGEATPLATIQQLDPIYVNLTQSSTELLRLQRALADGRVKSVGKGEAKVTLVTEDGQTYAQSGKLLFSDLTVDPSSGAITLRAEFPNPNKFLLPGMYVRARLEQGVNESAITVPQQAVQRDPSGTATVYVVAADGKVAPQPIKTGNAHESSWIVTEGLKAGDRVIVEGVQKVRPGAPVKPVEWKPQAANASGQASQAAPAAGGNGAAPAAPAPAAAGNESNTKANQAK